jgi:hypothetical protein
MPSGGKAMSNLRAGGGCGQKYSGGISGPGRPVAGAVLIFTEPPVAARRGPAGLPGARRQSLL